MLGSNPSADSVASTDPGGCCAIPLSSVCRHRARIGRGTKAQNPGGAGAKPLRHSLLPLRKPASSHNACIGLLAIVERSAPESRLFVQVESHPPEISKH
jgi:hypothetical protein